LIVFAAASWRNEVYIKHVRCQQVWILVYRTIKVAESFTPVDITTATWLKDSRTLFQASGKQVTNVMCKVGAVVQLVEYRTRNQEVAGSIHTIFGTTRRGL